MRLSGLNKFRVSNSGMGGGTAVANDVRPGKTFSNDIGDNLNGAMDLTNLKPENIVKDIIIDGKKGTYNKLYGSGDQIPLDKISGATMDFKTAPDNPFEIAKKDSAGNKYTLEQIDSWNQAIVKRNSVGSLVWQTNVAGGPYESIPWWDVSSDGKVYFAWEYFYETGDYNDDGDYVTEFYADAKYKRLNTNGNVDWTLNRTLTGNIYSGFDVTGEAKGLNPTTNDFFFTDNGYFYCYNGASSMTKKSQVVDNGSIERLYFTPDNHFINTRTGLGIEKINGTTGVLMYQYFNANLLYPLPSKNKYDISGDFMYISDVISGYLHKIKLSTFTGIWSVKYSQHSYGTHVAFDVDIPNNVIWVKSEEVSGGAQVIKRLSTTNGSTLGTFGNDVKALIISEIKWYNNYLYIYRPVGGVQRALTYAVLI